MRPDGLAPVARPILLKHVISSLDRYWPGRHETLYSLPVFEQPFATVSGPLLLADVPLPDWGRPYGIDGTLLVPVECCADPNHIAWNEVDWWQAIFTLLECWHERLWEQRNGPVHSYSFHLRGWDDRVWERAWVNRIALFLREWAARQRGIAATDLFGPLPQTRILMTHDVDAIEKTLAIRLKQGVFLGFNALRQLLRGQGRGSLDHAAHALRFLLSREDWWTIPTIQTLERNAGIRSRFHFYADERKRTFKRWLLDPNYDVGIPQLARLFADLTADGWEIGLHQSFDAWQSAELMACQRHRLQSAAHTTIDCCRQHWLRFSWAATWQAQAKAGMREDTTLMFNDRPGFRASAAVSWAPWNTIQSRTTGLQALPTILMDSHFYDYQPMQDSERGNALRYWIEETDAVHGEAAVLWHPHTLTSDYGWASGYHVLLQDVANLEARQSS